MKSPFKFLDSYTKDDREIFFGRDREIEELYQRVFESKLMLVYGVSGTGKSSLIHCGLANKFRETDWLPLVVRRGGNIINSMASAIQTASITRQEGQLSSPAQFRKSVKSLYLDHYKPVFFIFDQFEELFIFGDKEEDESFVRTLKTLLESDLQCKFIFIIREEFLGWLSTFEKSVPDFFSNRIRIDKMDKGNARKVIEGPCSIFNIEVEEGFADQMLEKLCLPKESDIELTYLQVYLDKIFGIASRAKKEEAGSLVFHISDLDRAGNVYNILGSFLDEQISHLPDQELAMTVLKAFVSARGTKRPATAEEIVDYGKATGKIIDLNTVNDLLISFVNLRILQEKDKNNKYEFRHDALATKIFEKITFIEKELLEIRQLIENAYNNWQKRGVLIGSEDLQYIAPYESRLYLQPEYESLIDRSKKALVRSRQRRRKLLSAAGIMLIIVLSGFSFWAIMERKNALQKERIANEAKIKATAAEQEAIKARDNAIESDKKAVASEKEALVARDLAKESEKRIKVEKELAVIRERQTRANNLNYLSKEMSAQDPTTALGLGEYALSLDASNESIQGNLIKLYSDNAFYKIFFKNNSEGFCQISSDWTKIISVNGRTARITDLNKKNSRLLIGHIISLFTIDVHQISRRGHDDITSVAFSPDGNYVLTGSTDLTARLWDTNGTPLQIFKGHINFIKSVAFSPDGKTVLTGSLDRSIRLWDLNGNCLQVFNGHKLEILSVAFAPDGQKILTGSADSTARLWDLNGTTLKILKGHSGKIADVAFSPDGKTILTGSTDQTARLWDLNGNLMQILTGHVDVLSALTFAPDGKTVITGSADKTARLWDLYGNLLQTFTGHGETVNSVSFSPDGNKILTFSTDGISRVWDISQNYSKTFTGHKDYIYKALFSPDGKTILTYSQDMSLKLWDLNGNTLNSFQLLSNSVAFSPDGKTILTGLWSGQLIDHNGKGLLTFTGHTQPILSVAFSNDGKRVLTGSADKSARLWDLNGKTLQIFNGHSDKISSVAFSPDGETILTGSWDNTARLWDLKGNTLKILQGHSNGINCVAFSPDGKAVLTGSADKTARIWDLTGKTMQIYSGHHDAIISVAFSPDNKTIILGSSDKTARLWDLQGNTLQILSGYKNPVYAVAFSPDGKTVLTGSGDKTAKLFNVKIPLSRYLSENISEELSVDQMLNYEIIQFEQLKIEEDPDMLFDGLRFFLSEAKVQKEKKSEYLNNADILFRKLEKRISSTTHREQYIICGYDLFTQFPQKYILDKIEKGNKLFISSSTKEEIKEAFDFYSERCIYLDSAKIDLMLPESLIQISTRLLSVDTASRYTISIDLASLSWQLIQARKFKTSLDAIKLAIEADSKNQYAYTTLPLALVLNNRFDEASIIYQKYYKDFILRNFQKSYRQIYLDDIANLEKSGVTHPDFSKVKEMLNK